MNSETLRQRQYDCRLCQESGNIDKRNCFWFGDEVQQIKVNQDVEDENGNIILKAKQEIEVESDDELLEQVIKIGDVHHKLSTLDICRSIFPTVCPKSLISEGVDSLLSAESFCREYSIPPLDSKIGYLDYPQILIDTFGVIACARERVRAKEMAEMRSKN